MPNWIRTYVRVVTAVNYRVGRIAMYLIFVMLLQAIAVFFTDIAKGRGEEI